MRERYGDVTRSLGQEIAKKLSVKGNKLFFSGKEIKISLPGEAGKDGKDGKDGVDGHTPLKGKDYFDGKNGRDGKDGRDGIDGKDGNPGRDHHRQLPLYPAHRGRAQFPPHNLRQADHILSTGAGAQRHVNQRFPAFRRVADFLAGLDHAFFHIFLRISLHSLGFKNRGRDPGGGRQQHRLTSCRPD